jgi:type IV fimbrial biogenesis protein FimT
MRTAARSRTHGFTTVELMIVVVIIGILTAFAAPAMTQMVRTQRVKTAAFDISASLVFARSEALKRNLAVTVTPTNAADWTQGWEVRDSNNNLLKKEGNRNLSDKELEFKGPGAITFWRNGRLNAPTTSFQLKGPYLPDDKARCISVDLSGRPASAEGLCNPPVP